MTVWDDLAARARGLNGRLLGPEKIGRLARAPDLDRLASALWETAYADHMPAARPSPAGMEEAVRRRMAADLRLLARRAGSSRARRLAVVFEDGDRRSLRVLVRGAVAGVPSELRLRGTLSTPSLPEDRLREAARASSLSSLARLVDGWGHPLAPALTRASGRLRPDLFRLELDLSRIWAERAAKRSRRADVDLREFVRETVDEENVWTVLARTGSPAGDEVLPFLDGGRWLELDAFRDALASPGREASASRLRKALLDSPFRGEPSLAGEGTLEERLLGRRVAGFVRRARLRPTGPAPLLLFVLRLRREALRLRRVIWGLALAAPPEARLVAGGST